MASPAKPFIGSSYNCRGFNSSKSAYLSSLLSKSSVLFLQEHWLADAQLSILGSICSNISYCGISGFDNVNVLSGRPYGGCAILWHTSLAGVMCPIHIDSRRVCAARLTLDSVRLLLINVYMPYEDGDDQADEFANILALIENVIESNSDCHVIFGGDFNVDFGRDWTHTALLSSFCENIGLQPVDRHASCQIDYTYNFSMSRFQILDHFILSGTLFDECVCNASVVHDVDNLSDHDPIFIEFKINVQTLAFSNRVFTPQIGRAHV